MLAMVFSCSKNEQSSDTPVYNEGIYNPAKKIVEVTMDDKKENWTWEGDLLTRVETIAEKGSATVFRYDGSRVTSIRPGSDRYGFDEIKVVYNGNAMSELLFYVLNRQVAKAVLRHNGEGKIDHADIQVDNEYVNNIISTLSLVFKDGGKLRKAVPTKLSVGSSVITVDLTWTGSNVSRAIILTYIEGEASGSEIASFVELASQFMEIPSEYTSVLSVLVGSDLIPYTVDVKDTLDYSYDGNPNPLQGYMGDMSVAVLSANNIVGQQTHCTLNGSLTMNLPFFGERTYNLPHTFAPKSVTHRYTYTPDNYPQTVTSDDGETQQVTTYTYAN